MAQKANRVRNWSKYNQALVNRGRITFWINKNILNNWYAGKTPATKGRPKKYSDIAITCGLTLKALFRLTFRAVEGFIKSFIKIFKETKVDVPNYTSLCKRQKSIKIALPKSNLNSNEKLQIVVDTTGLKVFGEGEWKVRQHGYVKHRLWRKLHLAINSTSQEIEAFQLTTLGIQDSEGFEKLIGEINRPIESAIGDGAYDRFSCYELAKKKDFRMIAPPQHNAKLSEERRNRKKASLQATQKRDQTIEEVRRHGRAEWKKKVGYHKRSLAETGIYRLKTILSNRLSTRKMENQIVETAIYCRIINKMTKLGLGF